MIEILSHFVIIYGIFVFSLISPGPDFIIVSRISLSSGVKAAIYAALGISLGLIFHLSYSILGVSAIIQAYPKIFGGVLAFASGYLLWLIINLIQDIKRQLLDKDDSVTIESQQKVLTPKKALYEGFIVNFTNVKCGIYFIAVFAPLVSKFNSRLLEFLMFISFFITTFVWFAIVALFFSREQVRNAYFKHKIKMDSLFVVILSLLLCYLIYNIFINYFLV